MLRNKIEIHLQLIDAIVKFIRDQKKIIMKFFYFLYACVVAYFNQVAEIHTSREKKKKIDVS